MPVEAPTIADCIEQIEYLTRTMDSLRAEVAELKARGEPGRDPDVVRLATMIPPGWEVNGLQSVSVPMSSVVRNRETGEWSRWRNGVCEARGTLAQVTRG